MLYLVQGYLQPIRRLDTSVQIVPWGQYRFMDKRCPIFQGPFQGKMGIWNLKCEADLPAHTFADLYLIDRICIRRVEDFKRRPSCPANCFLLNLAIMGDGYDDVALFVPFIHISVSLDHLIQWVASIYYRPEPPRFN